MTNDSVKTGFDAAAPTYDLARRQLVPCFDEFYGTVPGLIPYGADERFRVLDLGAGTGLLSLQVAERFAGAQLTLMDLSAAMLAQARERLSGVAGRCEFVAGDYASQVHTEFEVVISALSIHHLSDDLKVALFRRIHEVLPAGGVFINADQVLGATPEIERIYRETWLRQVRARGVAERDLNAALERMKEDRSAPLDSQLEWLRQAGFRQVNCWYQNYSFAVFSGQKQRP